MDAIIPTIVTCGSGADLRTLPLLVTAVLLWTDVQMPPENLMWLESHWALGAAAAIVAVEYALDTTCIRSPELKPSWNKLQHLMTVMVCVSVGVALSHGMSSEQLLAAITAGLVATNVIKIGTIDRIKSVFTLVGEA